MIAVKTVNLTKKYKDVVAVDGVNLEINKGELFSLLGVNGAGKTTLIKVLCTLTNSNGGSAYVNGYDVSKQSELVKKVIGVCPQETAIAPNLSVKENLEFFCGIYGFSKEKCQAKTSEIVSLLKLGGVLNKKAGKLSGGWQRRLSIAIALIGEPKVLFLDEPTLGLDVIARSELWDIILNLKGKTTIILTTHYLEEAEELSDRIGVMKNGKLLKTGTVSEFIELTNANTFEKAFISIVKGEVI